MVRLQQDGDDGGGAGRKYQVTEVVTPVTSALWVGMSFSEQEVEVETSISIWLIITEKESLSIRC